MKGDSAPQGNDAPLLQAIHLAYGAVGWWQLHLTLVSKVGNDDEDDKQWHGHDLDKGRCSLVFKAERVMDALPTGEE